MRGLLARAVLGTCVVVGLSLAACQGGLHPIHKQGQWTLPTAVVKCDEFGVPFVDISGGQVTWEESFAVGCYNDVPPGFIECFREDLPGLKHVTVCAYCHPSHPGVTFWNFGCVLAPQGCFIRSSINLQDWIEMVHEYKRLLEEIQEGAEGDGGLPQVGCLAGPEAEFLGDADWDGESTLSASMTSNLPIQMPAAAVLGLGAGGAEVLVDGLPAWLFAELLVPAGAKLQVIGDAPSALSALAKLGIGAARADDGSFTALLCPVLPVIQVFEDGTMSHLVLVTPDGFQELPTAGEHR